VAELGARPNVSPARRGLLRAARVLFTPLFPDDYLELINPLWSSREVRGRIESIERETADSVTIVIRPGWVWEGHVPGQFLRVGIVVDGVHHWRAYSLTSDPGRPDGCISITPKLRGTGKVSPYLVRAAQPGTIVRLGGVEGDFTLPDPPPSSLLFITAGSGITPIMSMLRGLERVGGLSDVVHVHSARTAEDVVFGGQLRELATRHAGYRLHLQLTAADGRLSPADLEAICPDWRTRSAFASGPGAMLDALGDHWERAGVRSQLRMERFQPVLDAHAAGAGGPISFTKSRTRTASDGTVPILVAGEHAGLELAYGCRMGICRTCVGRLGSGRVRDLRTGKVSGQPGEFVRSCIHAPEGPVEIAL
jgi:ferredoxin-NADP reductase